MSPQTRRPKCAAPPPPQRRARAAEAGGGGLIALLLAAEAAARVEPGPASDDAFDGAPAATSLADILDLAAICATRPSFSGFGEHRHDYFRPSFLHGKMRHGDHERGDFAGARHDGAHDAPAGAANAGHDGGHAPDAGAAWSSDHGTSGVDEAVPADAPHGYAPSAAPAGPIHAHDAPPDLLVDHGHDLDAGLDALLAAAHGGHGGAFPSDDAAAEAPPADGVPPQNHDDGEAHGAQMEASPSIAALLIGTHPHAESVMAAAEI